MDLLAKLDLIHSGLVLITNSAELLDLFFFETFIIFFFTDFLVFFFFFWHGEIFFILNFTHLI